LRIIFLLPWKKALITKCEKAGIPGKNVCGEPRPQTTGGKNFLSFANILANVVHYICIFPVKDVKYQDFVSQFETLALRLP